MIEMAATQYRHWQWPPDYARPPRPLPATPKPPVLDLVDVRPPIPGILIQLTGAGQTSRSAKDHTQASGRSPFHALRLTLAHGVTCHRRRDFVPVPDRGIFQYGAKSSSMPVTHEQLVSLVVVVVPPGCLIYPDGAPIGSGQQGHLSAEVKVLRL